MIVDGYELSRHEKIRYIIKNSEYLSYLRVCHSSYSNYNCGYCEKCLRTIIALTLEGIDPKNCNFDVDETVFQYVKDCLIKGKFRLSEEVISMWVDIQKYIPNQFNNDISSSKEFFTWFKEFDLSKYRMNKLRHFFWVISYIIAEKGVMKTLKKIPTFIVRKSHFR